MQDVPVVEAQAPARKPIVLVRIILEQRPDIERPLGAGPHQGARDVLLQLVQPGLVPAETRNVKRNAEKNINVPIVLVWLVLNTQLYRTPGALQNLEQKNSVTFKL